jgi:hypothetical protein
LPADRPLQNSHFDGIAAEDAYNAALKADRIETYQEFFRVFPRHPLAARIGIMLATRREALVWRRTTNLDSVAAYWTYLMHYPRGPHAADCRGRLLRLGGSLEPPPRFTPVKYDLPQPLPDESITTVSLMEVADLLADLAPPPPLGALLPLRLPEAASQRSEPLPQASSELPSEAPDSAPVTTEAPALEVSEPSTVPAAATTQARTSDAAPRENAVQEELAAKVTVPSQDPPEPPTGVEPQSSSQGLAQTLAPQNEPLTTPMTQKSEPQSRRGTASITVGIGEGGIRYRVLTIRP